MRMEGDFARLMALISSAVGGKATAKDFAVHIEDDEMPISLNDAMKEWR